MNYYKQGDAAKADKIKAAFEKLGYEPYGWTFETEFYFTVDSTKNVQTVSSSKLINIIKTHPDYKELELPVEPKFKFKVGDWIVQNDNGTVSQITKTINEKDEYGEYRAYEHTNGYFAACFENEYHFWTIADAKDGDVLVNDAGCIFINAGFENDDKVTLACYCYVSVQGIFYEEDYKTGSWLYTSHIHPATKEQRDLLFAKMKEAGYQWDADKKELHKIQSHYDIKNFHAGMPVLVRADNNCRWDYSVFSRITGNEDWQFAVCNGVSVAQCIPFEGNEHLLGTSDPCDEQYINW